MCVTIYSTCVICLDSWLPLSRVTRSGHLAFSTISLDRNTVHSVLYPPPPTEGGFQLPCKSLQAVVPPVHKIPHEDVVCIRWRTSTPEELLQIIELSMDVPTDSDRGGDRLDVGLLQQQVTHLQQYMVMVLIH